MPEHDLNTQIVTDPDELRDFISQGKRKYLQGQKMLIAARNAEKRLQRQGRTPPADMRSQRETLEQQLDSMAAKVRQAEAWLAARAVADGGDPLNLEQAEQLLLAIEASEASLALYREAPTEMTAMLNQLLTTLEGAFETRIGVIATHLRESDFGDA